MQYLHLEFGISSTGDQTRSALCLRCGSCFASSLSKKRKAKINESTDKLHIHMRAYTPKVATQQIKGMLSVVEAVV